MDYFKLSYRQELNEERKNNYRGNTYNLAQKFDFYIQHNEMP